MQDVSFVDVGGLVTHISATSGRTCAVLEGTSGVKCWGVNTNQVVDTSVNGFSSIWVPTLLDAAFQNGVSAKTTKMHVDWICIFTNNYLAFCRGSIQPGSVSNTWTQLQVGSSSQNIVDIQANGIGGICSMTATNNIACWGMTDAYSGRESEEAVFLSSAESFHINIGSVVCDTSSISVACKQCPSPTFWLGSSCQACPVSSYYVDPVTSCTACPSGYSSLPDDNVGGAYPYDSCPLVASSAPSNLPTASPTPSPTPLPSTPSPTRAPSPAATPSYCETQQKIFMLLKDKIFDTLFICLLCKMCPKRY
jgi:hypothetical protein